MSQQRKRLPLPLSFIFNIFLPPLAALEKLSFLEEQFKEFKELKEKPPVVEVAIKYQQRIVIGGVVAALSVGGAELLAELSRQGILDLPMLDNIVSCGHWTGIDPSHSLTNLGGSADIDGRVIFGVCAIIVLCVLFRGLATIKYCSDVNSLNLEETQRKINRELEPAQVKLQNQIERRRAEIASLEREIAAAQQTDAPNLAQLQSELQIKITMQQSESQELEHATSVLAKPEVKKMAWEKGLSLTFFGTTSLCQKQAVSSKVPQQTVSANSMAAEDGMSKEPESVNSAFLEDALGVDLDDSTDENVDELIYDF